MCDIRYESYVKSTFKVKSVRRKRKEASRPFKLPHEIKTIYFNLEQTRGSDEYKQTVHCNAKLRRSCLATVKSRVEHVDH